MLRGIHYFLGVPYGADTSGANRFMPPREPKPWTDVRPAIWWANTAPQNMENRYANPHVAFRDHWNYDDVSEDCLKRNVFTPAWGRQNLPFLFWIPVAASSIQRHRARRLPGETSPLVTPSSSDQPPAGPFVYCDLAGVGGEVLGIRQRAVASCSARMGRDNTRTSAATPST